MSTGSPSDPVCENQTTALTTSPVGVKTSAFPADPVCRTVTPPTNDQYSEPGAPP